MRAGPGTLLILKTKGASQPLDTQEFLGSGTGRKQVCGVDRSEGSFRDCICSGIKTRNVINPGVDTAKVETPAYFATIPITPTRRDLRLVMDAKTKVNLGIHSPGRAQGREEMRMELVGGDSHNK